MRVVSDYLVSYVNNRLIMALRGNSVWVVGVYCLFPQNLSTALDDSTNKVFTDVPLFTPNSDHLFKLILVGDSGVGKTSLLLRFIVSSCVYVYFSLCVIQCSPS